MGTGTLIKNRTDFENLIQTQVKKGQDLLKRNISEDSTTIINKRVGYVFKSKEYDRVEIEKFRSDYIKWDAFNSDLISHSFDKSDNPQSYYGEYGRTGNPHNLWGEDLAKEIKQQITEKITYLESLLERLPLIPSKEIQEDNQIELKNQNMSKEVFIVHGHDNELKQEVARFLSDMGFNPIILHEQPNTGKTIIEKIEEFSNVCFGIVLYTPCDKGGILAADIKDLKPRARQNVIFEHGYLMAKLGRKRVCALIKDEVEKPGDIDGVIYISYDSNGGWKNSIAKEIQANGLTFNINALLK